MGHKLLGIEDFYTLNVIMFFTNSCVYILLREIIHVGDISENKYKKY